jgi:hypothetical protein
VGTFERIAVSAAVLVAWGLLFGGLALVPDTGVQAFFASLAVLYGVAFFGVIARQFWARWFARGLGWWGALSGAMFMIVTGVGTVLVAFALSHAAVLWLLHGDAVATRYDGQERWREHLDDAAQRRIAGLFSNLGTALPYVAFYVFFPRQAGVAALAALALAGAGLVGLSRMRTWGLIAVMGAAVALGVSSFGREGVGGLALAALLAVGVVGFVPAMVRFLRKPSPPPVS